MFDFMFGSLRDAFVPPRACSTCCATKLQGKRFVFRRATTITIWSGARTRTLIELELATGRPPEASGELHRMISSVAFSSVAWPGSRSTSAIHLHVRRGALHPRPLSRLPRPAQPARRPARCSRGSCGRSPSAARSTAEVDDYEATVTLLTALLYSSPSCQRNPCAAASVRSVPGDSDTPLRASAAPVTGGRARRRLARVHGSTRSTRHAARGRH